MSAFAFTPEAAQLLARVSASEDDGGPAGERAARVVWSSLVEPGDSTAGRLVATMGARAALEAVIAGTLDDLIGVSDRRQVAEALERWTPRLSPQSVRDSLERAAWIGARLIVPEDPEWPPQIDDLGAHAPLALWVRGDAAVLASLTPSAAIVGARAATSYGEHVAMEIAADLGGDGIPVVSGAAYGIDGAAHRAALSVGGPTVALLAGGVDRHYPAGHAQLLERMVSGGGAVVSEVPCGSAPTKWRFLQRNRLIAALADATVVVEAGWRSGSLNTAAHALDLGRPVGVVPGPVTSAASAGCHRLLRESAAICVTNAAEVRELLGMGSDTPPGSGSSNDARPRTDDTARVRDALSTRSWRESEEVARRAGMATGDVEAILGLLALTGDVERSLVGWRRSSAAT